MVVGGLLRLAVQDRLEGDLGGGREHEQVAGAGQELAAVLSGLAHGFAPFAGAADAGGAAAPTPAAAGASSGLCGVWQLVQASLPACSAGSTWGKPAGRATDGQVAPDAEHAGIRADRLRRRGIGGMRRVGAVAGLAPDGGVLALGQHVADVRVAVEAGGAAGVDDRARPVVVECAGPVVAVDAEPLRNHEGLQRQEGHDTGHEQASHPDQVAPVTEQIAHQLAPPGAPVAAARRAPPGRPCRAGRFSGFEACVMFDEYVARVQEANGSRAGSNGPPAHFRARGWTPAAGSPKLGADQKEQR